MAKSGGGSLGGGVAMINYDEFSELTAQSKILRSPPAYQEYASDLLADHRFRSMTFGERGLLFTIKLECWVNERVPKDSTALENFIRATSDEMQRFFTPRVRSFLSEGEKHFLFPELENQKFNFQLKRSLQSKGGRNGGLKTQSKNREKPSESVPQGKLKAMRGDEMQREEKKRDVIKKDYLPNVIPEHKEWLQEFE